VNNYYKIAMDDRDFLRMPDVIQTGDNECYVMALPGAIIPKDAIAITEAEFTAKKTVLTEDPPILISPITELKENQLIIMDAVATIYEKIFSGGAV